MFTFLHSADWQIGRTRPWIRDPGKRERVRQARLETIRGLGAVARDRGAACVLVAGDVFESWAPDHDTVAAACTAIGAIGLPVYLIPGNHDHRQSGLWETAFFRRAREVSAPNLHVLLDSLPVDLGGGWLLPCPLQRRHEPQDTTAWIRSFDFGSLDQRPRIVLAHGGVQDFGGSGGDDEEEPPGAANRIDLQRLPSTEIDYVALGDWHGFKQVDSKAFYAGTPEIDRFPKGDQEPGHVAVVTAARGQPPRVERVATGRLIWKRIAVEVGGDEAAAMLRERLQAASCDADDLLLDLELTGSLGIAAREELDRELEYWRAAATGLRPRDSVRLEPTPAELDAICERPDPLLAAVARTLRTEAAAAGAGAATAREALVRLHALVREAEERHPEAARR